MNWATKLALALVLATGTTIGASGCDQGNEEKCREAIRNVLHVTGQENTEAVDEDAFVRSCRANSSAKSIKCMTEAKTVEELEKCDGNLGKEVAQEGAKKKAEPEGDSDK